MCVCVFVHLCIFVCCECTCVCVCVCVCAGGGGVSARVYMWVFARRFSFVSSVNLVYIGMGEDSGTLYP